MNVNAFFLADIVGDTAREFGVNWPHFIAQVISFGIVAFLLHRFAYKPILQVLEERRTRIAESLANAERIKEELAKAEVTRDEILTKANAHATELIEEARAAAAKVLESESHKAVVQAEQIVAKAREAIAAERNAELAALRKEIGQLVVRISGQVTGKILTPEDQKRLLDETAKELAA